MIKILKPYTIIPASLYVERSADRQVENIIKEMGRPGYVLVSRQMGKTNLLLNARRKYSNAKDKFAYIDLSNIYGNELECFRNIIDTTIETNLESLTGLDIEIKTFRENNSNLPPHKQHERELRILLNKIQGKLIIILDEIDALTKTDYSDRIFAQIRSIYFARTNFQELERLTYLLSGVVEPTELIKDPKISPFNIGEKIFLNDFSFDEFQNFIEKSGLNKVNDSIKERVYYWTNGNPRLTWDIFSVVEDEIENTNNEEDVDKIIKKHYLTTFDKPPIDNIREIVKKDKTLKNALIEIDYGKGNLITDEIKQKLYLAGIINLDEKDIRIKNRIIRLSLSNSWIESLGEGITDFLQKGIDFYNNSAYKPAIENLTKALENKNLEETEINITKLYLGLSHYYDSEVGKAKHQLQSVSLNPKEFGKLHSITQLHLGYIHIIDSEYSEAKNSFEEVIKLEIFDDIYLSALINLIQILINSENENEIKYGTTLINETIEKDINLFSLEDSAKFYEIQFIIGQIIFEKNILDFDRSKIVSYFEGLIEKIPSRLKTNLFLILYKCLKESNSKSNKYLELATENILDNELKTRDPRHKFDVCFNSSQLRELEVSLFIENKIKQLNELIEFEIKTRRTTEEKILDVIIGFAQEQNLNDHIIFQLAEYFYENSPPKDELIRRNLLFLLGNYTYKFDSKNDKKYAFELLDYILEKDEDELDFEAVSFLMITINQFLISNEINKAKHFIKKSYDIQKRLPNELKDTFIITNFFELLYFNKIGEYNNARHKAAEILNLANSSNAEKSKNPLIKSNLRGIIQECNQTLNQSKQILSSNKHHTPGRNEVVTVKYINGETKKIKYKRIKDDIAKGLCILI